MADKFQLTNRRLNDAGQIKAMDSWLTDLLRPDAKQIN
jgi:hypothetical protein